MPKKKVLTKEERHGEEAFALHQEIVSNEQKRRALLIKNISNLSELYLMQGYKDILGDENAGWDAYLGQLDVYYTRGEVARRLKVKDKLIDEYGLSFDELLDLPETRIGDIAYLAASPDEAREMLQLAKVLTSSEWKDEIHRRTGKHTREDGHAHDMKKYEICKVCGMKHAI